MSSVWTRSPQDVDPLSWFTGPRMPLAFSIAGIVQGIAIIVIYWDSWSNVVLELVALPFFLAAGWLTTLSAHPSRRRFRLRDAVAILALACLGVVVSAVGAYGGSVPVAQWWAGIALGATFVGLSPYCTPRKQLICAFPLVAFMAIVGWIVFSPQTDFWPPAALVIIAAGPVTISAAASVVFAYTVVARTLEVLDPSSNLDEFLSAPDAADPTGQAPAVVADADQQKGTIARMSARVAPFLESVAAAGVITPENRALAAQLARRLRTELVTATSRSWLDLVAHETGMIVSDPGRLADSMNESQRAALQGLLVAAMDSTVVDRQTLLIELRAQPDGSTAVALSIDVDLPEGRRLVLLAPYYLTLKTTVDDLSWDDGRRLLMRFRIPPA
jgi:hypothetical protein